MILVPFEPEVRNLPCCTVCANFGFGALVDRARRIAIMRRVRGAVAVQRITMCGEPALRALPLGADGSDDAPEAARVIHLAEMRDLVRGEVVQHIGRREDQSP